MIAYLNIDEVIRIVREEDNPRAELMARFALSEIQANAILDLRLRQLARLEEIKLTTERDELDAEKADIDKTLKSKARLKTLIKKELLADAEAHGDARRSPLEAVAEAAAFTEEDLLTNEPITVVMSEKGWIRAAKGHDVNVVELSYRTGRCVPDGGEGSQQRRARGGRFHRPSVLVGAAHVAVRTRPGRAAHRQAESAGRRALRRRRHRSRASSACCSRRMRAMDSSRSSAISSRRTARAKRC